MKFLIIFVFCAFFVVGVRRHCLEDGISHPFRGVPCVQYDHWGCPQHLEIKDVRKFCFSNCIEIHFFFVFSAPKPVNTQISA